MKLTQTIAEIILSLLLIPLVILIWAVSMTPGILLADAIIARAANSPPLWRAFALGLAVASTFFVWGIASMTLTAIVYRVLPLRIRPGEYPLGSPMMIRWGIASALHRMVRLTFLPLITPTFLSDYYLSLMGAKVGLASEINTPAINDPWLTEVGPGAVVGGAAVVNAHSMEGGKLILRPVKIGRNALVGADVLIWPGVVLGEDAVVAPRSVVSKFEQIGAGEVWGGTPAEFIRLRRKYAAESALEAVAPSNT